MYSRFVTSVTPWMSAYKRMSFIENYDSLEFEPCLLEYDDLKKMKTPELTVDREATEQNYQLLSDCVGDILTVVKGQPYSSYCG